MNQNPSSLKESTRGLNEVRNPANRLLKTIIKYSQSKFGLSSDPNIIRPIVNCVVTIHTVQVRIISMRMLNSYLMSLNIQMQVTKKELPKKLKTIIQIRVLLTWFDIQAQGTLPDQEHIPSRQHMQMVQEGTYSATSNLKINVVKRMIDITANKERAIRLSLNIKDSLIHLNHLISGFLLCLKKYSCALNIVQIRIVRHQYGSTAMGSKTMIAIIPNKQLKRETMMLEQKPAGHVLPSSEYSKQLLNINPQSSNENARRKFPNVDKIISLGDFIFKC